MCVDRMLKRARGVVRYDGCGPLFGDGHTDVVRVVSGVCDHELGDLAIEKCCSPWSVAFVAGGEDEPYRTAKSSHRQVNFRAQTAARTSDGLILSPPFAPLAC